MENQEVSSNSQATPEVATPPAAGNQAADLATRVAELERQSEGRLRDLQEERRKRQELEQRIAPAPAPSAVPHAEEDVVQDEVAKVLNPYLAPVRKQAAEAFKMQQQLLAKYQEDAAFAYLAEKTGKSRKQLEADTEFQQRLTKTAQNWGFVGNIDEVARRAYEAMELEDFRAKQMESTRAAQAAAQASLPAGDPPASVSKGREYSATEFDRMSASEFEALSTKGSFRKIDGKFVYTPRS
jgi:hypothetical protein